MMTRILPLMLLFAAFCGISLPAQDFNAIGLTVLRAVTTNLNGAGIRAAQPEAYDNGTTNWEVNGGYLSVGHPTGFFTYVSANGSSTSFPNSLSGESGHADIVGSLFYGLSFGVATNLAHLDNYDVNYFIQGYLVGGNYVFNLPAFNINDPVVNQSFSFGSVPVNEQVALDKTYDNYAAQYNTLFVSAACANGQVAPPGTSYNGISVSSYPGASIFGPTLDNGRAKPDITSPSDATSHSTPAVAGAAALLIQAGLRGDGGSDTSSAVDIRTLKALLLNGAVKPVGWTNIAPAPLDFNNGAGVLNIFNSYEQLIGGRHTFNFSTNIPQGTVHPPVALNSAVPVLSGWNFTNLTSASSSDAVHHYFFNVTNGSGGARFMLTATLAWNRQRNQTAINNLELFLYDSANNALVAASTSLVDNVQHIFVPKLPPGRYDLQVWKAAGNPGSTIVSSSETYALAYAFVLPQLQLTNSGTADLITWPLYPGGFTLQSETSLTADSWNTNNLPLATITNGQNLALINPTNATQFFRLQSPNF